MGEYEYTFPAIAGIQAGYEYYTTMLPLRLLGRLFPPAPQDGDPGHRSQRQLSKARIPGIARYITDNPDSYVFPALTVTVDADIGFERSGDSGLGRRMGTLHVPMSAGFSVNDGQHRVAGILEALKAEGNRSLGDESISVTLFLDTGTERSQQRFADLNRHAVRPAPSITVLYDRRDETAGITRHVVDLSPALRDLTELERSALPRRSAALFTLSALDGANRALLHGLAGLPPGQRADLAAAYWQVIAGLFPEWERARRSELDAAGIRREFIHASALGLHALGRVGNALVSAPADPGAWQRALAPLPGLDWRRRNAGLWEGRATSGGRLVKSRAHVLLTTAAIRRALGMPLPPDEQRLDEEFTARSAGLPGSPPGAVPAQGS